MLNNNILFTILFNVSTFSFAYIKVLSIERDFLQKEKDLVINALQEQLRLSQLENANIQYMSMMHQKTMLETQASLAQTVAANNSDMLYFFGKCIFVSVFVIGGVIILGNAFGLFGGNNIVLEEILKKLPELYKENNQTILTSINEHSQKSTHVIQEGLNKIIDLQEKSHLLLIKTNIGHQVVPSLNENVNSLPEIANILSKALM